MAGYILLVTNWTPPQKNVEALKEANPDLEVYSHVTEFTATEFPKEVPEKILKDTRVLLTWKLFPKQEQVPKLEYVQLMSAGCNQIQGLSLFEDTKIPFCTANGVHPYVTSASHEIKLIRQSSNH